MATELVSAALPAVSLARDGSAGAMGEADRAGARLVELAQIVYASNPEGVRAALLDTLPALSVGKRARELARRIREILEVSPATAADPVYVPVGSCPGCGAEVGQDLKACRKCGIREGEPAV